jgi:hypothetical protein
MDPSRLTIVLSSVFLLLATGCATDYKKKEPRTDLSIGNIKSVEFEKHLGHRVRVKGYFVDKPTPMLVTDLKWLNINSPIPESEYILLSGKGVTDLPREPFYGAEVVVSGVVSVRKSMEVELMRRKFGAMVGIELICPDPPIITKPPIDGIIIPELYDLCRFNPKLCLRPPRLYPRKYALLVSGGINSWNAHIRYWNDLKFMNSTLHNQYGFDHKNIVVAYKDGGAEDTDMTVDYAADTQGIADAFTYLRDRMTNRDTLVIFVTNHGGGYAMDMAAAANYGGRVDASGDETDEAIFEAHVGSDLNADGDQVDHVRFDEVTYLYNSASDLWDDDFAQHVDSLTYDKMIIILEPCFSGGNLADLRGHQRIIMSAASEYEFSWGGGPGNHDIFSYYVTSALAGQSHDGTAVNADSNGDGKVSVLEAFEYAQANDTAAETPFYEDNGDGRGHTGPFPVDGDGEFGATVTLD